MKIIQLEEDKITFDNGHVLLFNHNQDCCENVYADCINIQALSHVNAPLYESEFDEIIKYEIVQEIGIQLINQSGMKYLISCYNRQNGYYYYGDQLEMFLLTSEQFLNFQPYLYPIEENQHLLYLDNVPKKDDING